jgi:predicted heme/steroid binding protein
MNRCWTLAEVAKHKYCDDGWIAVEGQVYDITGNYHFLALWQRPAAAHWSLRHFVGLSVTSIVSQGPL